MKNNRIFRFLVLGLAGSAMTFSTISLASGLVGAFSEESSIPVISYILVASEMNTGEAGISVHIYGNGEVQIHKPNFRKDAGDYTLQLAPEELDEVLSRFEQPSLEGFDSAAVQTSMRQSLQGAARPGQRPTLYAVSDADITIIEFPQRSFAQRAMAGAAASETRIVWRALAQDAARHPEVLEVQDLRAAEVGLRELLDHPKLERVHP